MSKFRYVAVPFEAVARLHELTPKAALLYVHYCQWRNEASGLAWPSLGLIARTMHVPRATACRLRQQLAANAWLEIVEEDTVRLLVGFAQEAENGAGSVGKTTDDLHLIKCAVAEAFFRQHPELGVLSFWEWDKKHNPQPFPEQSSDAAGAQGAA